jgi:5-methylcytosine-specific restriction endonuclease McrA
MGQIEVRVTMATNTGIRDKILELWSKGLSKNAIKRQLNCSIATVCYHCSDSFRERRLKQNSIYKKVYGLQTKITHFIRSSMKKYERKIHIHKQSLQKRLLGKINKFKQIVKKHNGVLSMISIEQVKNLLQEKPYCYITGRPINIYDTSSYQFDHIMPASRGGAATIDNLGFTCKEANLAKNDRTIAEHLQYCKEVLVHHGYTITKSSEK